MTLRTTSIVLSALLALTLPATAQDHTGVNLDKAATGQPGGVAQYDMAMALYALGVTHKDALLALTAAKLAAGVQITEVTRDGVQTQAEVMPEEEGSATRPADLAIMLAAARDFAGEDETFLGVIEGIERDSAPGRIGGAARELNPLPGGAADRWKIPFYGSSYAEIGVFGDGDTPLAVIITDENGNEVTCPSRTFNTFYCAFVPRWNGYFEVLVTNEGRLRNSYFLLTN